MTQEPKIETDTLSSDGNEKGKIKIESDGIFTKVYTPNGDLIPCASVRFIHIGVNRPKAFLEVYDFELDAEVSEDALEFVHKRLKNEEEK